jgi:hypothetical protein
MNESTLKEIQAMDGLNCIDILIYTGTDPTLTRAEREASALKYINDEMGTAYSPRHLYFYAAEKAKTPGTIRYLAMRCALQYLFGDEVAHQLRGLWSSRLDDE